MNASTNTHSTYDSIWNAAAEIFRGHANAVLHSLADPTFDGPELDQAKAYFATTWPNTPAEQRWSALISIGQVRLANAPATA